MNFYRQKILMRKVLVRKALIRKTLIRKALVQVALLRKTLIRRAPCAAVLLALAILLSSGHLFSSVCVRASAAEAAEQPQPSSGLRPEELLDLPTLDDGLSDAADDVPFSFSDLFQELLGGKLPEMITKIPKRLKELLLSELAQQRKLAVQLLVVALAGALFSNFIRVFDSRQIAEISFYMIYLLASGLLIRSFSQMSRIVAQSCEALHDFMKVLLPSYLATVVFCAGSASALGFYEITLLGIWLLQTVVLRAVLPAIHFYMVLLLLNQLSEEEFFSKAAGFLETVISWSLRTVTGLIVGLQAVQCLVAPSVDALKGRAVHGLARALPGVGGVLDSAAETVAASALVIKNAVGVAGMLALAAICLLPAVKLVVCMLLFRLLAAVLQPVCEKRMVHLTESISKGASLLLRLLVMSLSAFVISLAMITAAVRGG